MSRQAAWFVHLSVVVAGLTGIVYGWMRYLLEPQDEWSIVNHPWEPDLKSLHIVGVPLLVFGCGLLWRHHIWARIRSGFEPRRLTGILLALLLPLMVLSGYALQVVTDESWREGWVWSHGISSCLWVLVYLIHQLRPRSA